MWLMHDTDDVCVWTMTTIYDNDVIWYKMLFGDNGK